MRTVTARVKSIEAHRQAAEAKNLISNPSPSGDLSSSLHVETI